MKIWMASILWLSAAGAMGQASEPTPAAQAQAATAAPQAAPSPVPTRPRLTLTTTAFDDGGIIPNMYTMAAEETPVPPRLMWMNVPDGTVSFALILHDPDTSLSK
jgi:phosphatidylethanolamine-binding protein (PEBP) family uncharacterized protein